MEQRAESIVVVEDDAGLRQAIERVLKAAGYRPSTFGSAESALASGLGAADSCMVLDVRLPGLSGFDLRDRWAAAGVVAPVIFITAHDEPASRRRAAACHAAYMPKPFEGQELLEAVSRALSAPASSS
jgi:FixJ family two-component response regulator